MSYGDQYEEGEYDGDAQNGSDFHDEKYGQEEGGTSGGSEQEDEGGEEDEQEEG